ncbi:MAG: hypothetical protein KY476_04980, partial [Planctomycetes bacterium]|nr:hypothetical protein [Planctomycetota bacterium]
MTTLVTIQRADELTPDELRQWSEMQQQVDPLVRRVRAAWRRTRAAIRRTPFAQPVRFLSRGL